jgi:hypothetical protein
MDPAKLGRTERVLAIVGLGAFINSFLPWYSASFAGVSYSSSAWDEGFFAWFATLLLVAIGVWAALPALGQSVAVRGGYAAVSAAAALAALMILIRLLTYPSASYQDGSRGAGFATYLGLIMGIVATTFAWLAFAATGGTLNNFTDAFRTQPQPQEGDFVVPPQSPNGYTPPESWYGPQGGGPYSPPQGGYEPQGGRAYGPPANYVPPGEQQSDSAGSEHPPQQ